MSASNFDLSKTRPFDIEEAKESLAKGVPFECMTKAGGKVRVICVDRLNENFPVVCIHATTGREECVVTHTASGSYRRHGYDEKDLVIPLKPKKVYTIQMTPLSGSHDKQFVGKCAKELTAMFPHFTVKVETKEVYE